MLKWLEGKKTYITAALFAIFNFGVAMNWWTPDNQIVITLNTLLGALGFGFLRSGVKKSSG